MVVGELMRGSDEENGEYIRREIFKVQTMQFAFLSGTLADLSPKEKSSDISVGFHLEERCQLAGQVSFLLEN